MSSTRREAEEGLRNAFRSPDPVAEGRSAPVPGAAFLSQSHPLPAHAAPVSSTVLPQDLAYATVVTPRSVPASRPRSTEGPGGLCLTNSRTYRRSTQGGQRGGSQGRAAGKYAGPGEGVRPQRWGSRGRPGDLACPPPRGRHTPPRPRPEPTRRDPPVPLHTPCRTATAPPPRASRRACAEPSPYLAPPSRRSGSFTSHHPALSLTMGRVSPQRREAGTTKSLSLGAWLGSSGQCPIAAVRRRNVCLARPQRCRGNPPLSVREARSGGSRIFGSSRPKAGFLTRRPRPFNPVSTFQSLAVLAVPLFSLFCIWLA